jgi:hypothetical protein
MIINRVVLCQFRVMTTGNNREIESESDHLGNIKAFKLRMRGQCGLAEFQELFLGLVRWLESHRGVRLKSTETLPVPEMVAYYY